MHQKVRTTPPSLFLGRVQVVLRHPQARALPRGPGSALKQATHVGEDASKGAHFCLWNAASDNEVVRDSDVQETRADLQSLIIIIVN